jgi:hypothetical protein
MTASPDFRYWNSVDPSTFLDHDWQNPSRQWATREAIKAAKGGTLLEVGPGPGVDYERYFSKAKGFRYKGWEGSLNLCIALQSRFPKAMWVNGELLGVPTAYADVVYARHVMEHQPALEPALARLLGAARHTVVLTWYRPPGPVAFFEVWEGVHCQTYKRSDVLESVARAGFRIDKSELFTSGDEAWLLRRTA